MMEQRSEDMERGQNHESVGERFVHVLDGMGQRAVRSPWRRDMEEAEYGQGVAARKLQQDAGRRYGRHEAIEQPMADRRQIIRPWTEASRRGLRRVCDSPREARKQDCEHDKAQGHM